MGTVQAGSQEKLQPNTVSLLITYKMHCDRTWPMQVETIGDAYMAVTNLVEPDPQHAATMVRFALRAQEEAAKVPTPGVDDGSTLRLRIGKARDIEMMVVVNLWPARRIDVCLTEQHQDFPTWQTYGNADRQPLPSLCMSEYA